MVKAIERGIDKIYTTWYKCSDCGCGTILEHYKFCPVCGKKIDSFKDRCPVALNNDGGWFCCELELGHKGEHKAMDHKWSDK